MRVKTAYKVLDDLPSIRLAGLTDVPRLKAIGYNAAFVPLGTEFIVYGIHFSEGNAIYSIADPPGERHLILGLAALFDIVDPRPSRHWECRIDDDGSFALWPPSWFQHCYHDRLSDGERAIVEDFERVKKLFEEEDRASSSAQMR